MTIDPSTMAGTSTQFQSPDWAGYLSDYNARYDETGHLRDSSAFGEDTGGWNGKWESPGDWGPIGALKDVFSTQDAGVENVNAADYQLGGDAERRDRTLAAMYGRGMSSADVMSRIGNDAYYQMQQGGAATLSAGQDVLSREIGKGTIARSDELANAYQAQELARQAGVRGDAIRSQYGDTSIGKNWQQSTTALNQYGPSAGAQQTANALWDYNPGAVGENLQDSYQRLQAYASRGPGPSAAEAQLRLATDQNVANSIAMARSGRGAGENATAARQALFASGASLQQGAGQLAELRANEAATWRQQQLQALASGGGVAGQQANAQLATSGLDLQGRTSAAAVYANQDQARLQALQAAAGQYGQQQNTSIAGQQAADAMRLGWGNQELTAQQSGAGQASNAWNTYLGTTQNADAQYLASVGNAANIQSVANQQRLSGYQLGLGSQAAYDQAALGAMDSEANRRTQLAAAHMSEQAAASRANQQADIQSDQGAAGMLGMGLGALVAL